MEAKNCPSIVVADVDTASFNQQQTVRVLPVRGSFSHVYNLSP